MLDPFGVAGLDDDLLAATPTAQIQPPGGPRQAREDRRRYAPPHRTETGV